jgi:hypothetical protein
VTLADLLPALPRVKERKHRQADTIRRLRREKRELLDRERAADDYFTRLLADRATVYAAWESAEQKRQEAETVAACALDENGDLTAEVTELRRQLAPFLAAEANANRVDVPPMERDTSNPADQATGPINVTTLWEALNVHYTGPDAANPTHVPSWAREDDTVPVPTVREGEAR